MDWLRVLVVGAVVAGASVAQLLHRQGLHPVLVERSAVVADAGYMLGLMPLADEPRRRLGGWKHYREQSVAMHRYQLRSSRGRTGRMYSLDGVLARYGRYGGIERSALLQAMTAEAVRATLGATVTSLRPDANGVTATRRTGADLSDARFDLVILADGMHSAMRKLVLTTADVRTFDTGWGGWVAWAEPDPTAPDLYAETWGRGFFIGRSRSGTVSGCSSVGPVPAPPVALAPFVERIRTRLRRTDTLTAQALAAIEHAHDPYHWRLADTRSRRWAVGRVVLLGDAAAGFLPTAGIGLGWWRRTTTLAGWRG